jgi:hypothetical protein
MAEDRLNVTFVFRPVALEAPRRPAERHVLCLLARTLLDAA